MAVKFARYTTTAGMGSGSMTFVVHEGEAWDADDPLVKANQALFSDEPVVVHSSTGKRQVEQATAAPGEKRKR